MGQDIMRRPPKFVQGFIDRHGPAQVLFPTTRFQTCAAPGAAVVARVHGLI